MLNQSQFYEESGKVNSLGFLVVVLLLIALIIPLSFVYNLLAQNIPLIYLTFLCTGAYAFLIWALGMEESASFGTYFSNLTWPMTDSEGFFAIINEIGKNGMWSIGSGDTPVSGGFLYAADIGVGEAWRHTIIHVYYLTDDPHAYLDFESVSIEDRGKGKTETSLIIENFKIDKGDAKVLMEEYNAKLSRF